MKLTRREMELIHEGLIESLAQLRNTLNTCPDEDEYEDELIDLDVEIREYETLLLKIKKELRRLDKLKTKGDEREHA